MVQNVIGHSTLKWLFRPWPYLDKDASGMPKVYEDRIVQARVIAVAEKVVRAEIFGVETSILAGDLSFDWMGDARERFQVCLLYTSRCV